MRQVDIVGFLLVYNPAYLDEAVFQFRKILSSVKGSYQIIVISNNIDIQKCNDFDGVFLHGDNNSMEFSGWQKGLDYIKNHYSIGSIKAYVFANDTFCHHKPLTVFQRSNYIDGVESCIRSTKSSMYGPLSSFGKTFSINNKRIDSWISTYFFIINQKAMEEILKYTICMPSSNLKNYFGDMANEDNFFSDNMDMVLKGHLKNWLFCGGKGLSWYKCASLSELNKEQMYLKACSILREKLLTVTLLQGGGDILEIQRSVPDKCLFKLISLKNQLANKLRWYPFFR